MSGILQNGGWHLWSFDDPWRCWCRHLCSAHDPLDIEISKGNGGSASYPLERHLLYQQLRTSYITGDLHGSRYGHKHWTLRGVEFRLGDFVGSCVDCIDHIDLFKNVTCTFARWCNSIATTDAGQLLSFFVAHSYIHTHNNLQLFCNIIITYQCSVQKRIERFTGLSTLSMDMIFRQLMIR